MLTAPPRESPFHLIKDSKQQICLKQTRPSSFFWQHNACTEELVCRKARGARLCGDREGVTAPRSWGTRKAGGGSLRNVLPASRGWRVHTDPPQFPEDSVLHRGTGVRCPRCGQRSGVGAVMGGGRWGGHPPPGDSPSSRLERITRRCSPETGRTHRLRLGSEHLRCSARPLMLPRRQETPLRAQLVWGLT